MWSSNWIYRKYESRRLGQKKTDTNGRILILDFKMIDETNFVLVNIYIPNTDTEQVTTLLGLGKLLKAI